MFSTRCQMSLITWISTVFAVLILQIFSGIADAQVASQVGNVPLTYSQSLPAGTTFQIVSTAALSSASAKKGESLSFRVFQDVDLGNTVVLPAGLLVNGIVVGVRRAGPFGRSGMITLSANSIVLANGSTAPIKLVSGQSVRGRDRSGQAVVGGLLIGGIAGYAVGYASAWNDNSLFSSHSSPVPGSNAAGAAAVGALVVAGFTRGGNANIPTGTVFDAALTEDLPVSPSSLR